PSCERLADAARNLRTNGLTNVRAIARGATKRLFDTRRNLTGIRNNANVTNGYFGHDLPPVNRNLGRGKTQPFVHLFDRNRVHLESVSAAKQYGAIVSCRLLRCGRHTRPRGWRRLLAFAPATLKVSPVKRVKHTSQKMCINSPKSRLTQLTPRNSRTLIGL